jgi:hypothetical protein
MKIVTKYIAEDGTEFEYEHECAEYEDVKEFRGIIDFPISTVDYRKFKAFFKTVMLKEEREDKFKPM